MWEHANITKQRKKQIFDACVLPKLCYGLEGLCLLQAERRRLDSFYLKHLRRIWKIKPSFISHVTNEYVYGVTGAEQLSSYLLRRQLQLYWEISAMSTNELVRAITFNHDSNFPSTFNLRRKRGRPRLQWKSCMHAIASSIATACHKQIDDILGPHSSKQEWLQLVHDYFYRLP